MVKSQFMKGLKDLHISDLTVHMDLVGIWLRCRCWSSRYEAGLPVRRDSLFCVPDELPGDAEFPGAWTTRPGLGKVTGGSRTGSLFCLAEESSTLESKCSSNRAVREQF